MAQQSKRMTWLNQLENWLFPAVGTQRHPLLEAVPADMDDTLLAELAFWQQGCPRCAMPGKTSLVCGDCLTKDFYLEKTQSLLIFNDAAKQMIHGLKYQGELFWSRALAELMCQRIDASNVDALIAVPLHPNRLSERGFNQSYEIAKGLSKRFGIPLLQNTVLRAVDTPHQTLLDKQQRQRNLKNAFEVDGERLSSIKHIALIDDVMTTGATLEQLGKTLKKHYPHLTIQAWVVARAV